MHPWFLAAAVAVTLAMGGGARADEGGTSVWLTGSMGSFSAAPSEPGWSLPVIYYHSSVDASASQLFDIAGQVSAGLHGRGDLIFLNPTYVFSTPVLGAQAALGVTAVFGHAEVDVNATLTGPGGLKLSGSRSDSVDGMGDLFPMGTLKWNRGVNNFMVYAMPSVPVGSYQVDRLANLGTNHWALDLGGGYTYLDPAKGQEFTAVLGFTNNFTNPTTDYKNGLDAHLDWAASQFLSEKVMVGAVGYFYQQLTGDSGSGAVLGDFKSQVAGIGPQMGYFFKVGDRQWYANLKTVFEFNANNRPAGWNLWLTLSIPLGPGEK